jgi:prepilin peptidase CpaA
MMTADAMALAMVVAGTGTGAAIDLRIRRVPNTLTMALALTGMALAATGLGSFGVPAAIAGWCFGLGLMLPGYLLGATGAGDVKLMAAVGALLGPDVILWAFLYTTIAGGAIALLVAALRGRLRTTFDETMWLVATRGANRAAIEDPKANNRFPYAPAIAIGAVLAAAVGGIHL